MREFLEKTEETSKREAMALGLTEDMLKEHIWNDQNVKLRPFSPFNYQAETTLNYLRNQIFKGTPASDAFNKIKGLNAYYIEAIGLGLAREDQREGHAWDLEYQTGYQASATVDYLRKQTSKEEEPVSALEAFNKIRGLNGFQIEAIELGLTREDFLEGHDWTSENWLNGCQASHTVGYLQRQVLKGVSPSDAFKKIKGLNGFQIEAIELGLTREDLEGHNWNAADGSEALNYLRNRPLNDVSAQQAMNNIRGLANMQIKALRDARYEGMEFGITATQAYVTVFDQDKLRRIRDGESYRDVAPEGYEAILKIEQRKQQYAVGATSGFLEAKDLNPDLANKIAPHLTPEAGGVLARITKKTAAEARTFKQKEMARQQTEKERPQR